MKPLTFLIAVACLCSCSSKSSNQKQIDTLSNRIVFPVAAAYPKQQTNDQDIEDSDSEPDWEPVPKNSYTIIKFKPTHNSFFSKKLIEISAYYNNDNPTKKELKRYLRDIWGDALGYDFGKPADNFHILVWLFSSKRKYLANKSAWDAMLEQAPGNEGKNPEVILSSKYKLSDEEKKVYYNEANLFKSKGADFSEAYYLLEKATIKSDLLFKPSVFQSDKKKDEYIKQVVVNYLEKHKIPDSLYNDISFYGPLFSK